MKERPILMSADMVRAILDGRKSQTRRLIKPQPAFVDISTAPTALYDEKGRRVGCPYGKPGDRLWVREGWWHHYDPRSRTQTLEYRADVPTASHTWRPSIHMPRWASRITLEVKAVRVEQLQRIWLHEVGLEGLPPKAVIDDQFEVWTLKQFAEFWDGFNQRGYRWQDNPWVWVVEFERIKEL